MRLSLFLLALTLLASCAASSPNPLANGGTESYLREGDDCAQTQIEARWLVQIISEKQKWHRQNHKRYTSSMESIVGELTGQLRYNALFLRTEPQDLNTWSFYSPGAAPRPYQHNLFQSIARSDNALLQGERRALWIDSRYRTLEFTEEHLTKICPDCSAGKDKFKAAIVAKFPNGKIDLWTLNESGVLNHVMNACGK
jgi:hypothetical protein